ncbi:Toll-Interleukin-Resistance [Hirschfeldia incana]|nr:Toll-Interleukin-Resistance [Hirschfeldia incana]
MGNSKNMPQVFINFRGKDERQKLLPHLKHHLKDSNVNVFTDDDAIGEPLKNLFRHIRRSRIVIVVFSINYLESEWCLDELVEIRKCLETEKIDFAIPIFYKVKTSHVKKQSGKFGKRFIGLQKKHRSSRIRRWKKALRFVSKSIGLTYKKRSSVSNLDFIKKIAERVNITLTKVESKDSNNSNTPETSKGEASSSVSFGVKNEHINLSNTLEALNLEISYLQGFISGSAWKDGDISSVQSSNCFRAGPDCLQFQRNLWRFDVLRNESIDKAIDWPALNMASDQPHPGLIFSNWDKLDQVTKYNIMYSAQKKNNMLKAYDRAVDSRPILSPNFQSFLEVPTWYRMLDPRVPQVWPHHDYKDTSSYHNTIPQCHPSPNEMVMVQNPVVRRLMVNDRIAHSMSSSSLRKKSDLRFIEKKKTSCFSFFGYYFKLCFTLTWGMSKEDVDNLFIWSEEEDIDELWKIWSDFSVLTHSN